MLVACTKDDVTTTASFEELKATQPTPVAFSTYLGDQAVTRAGSTGDITDATSLNTAGGFGVFAYYTNEQLYPNTKGATVGTTASALAPNFMHNQQVAYASGTTNWTYSPIKYWPNDFNGANQAVDARTSGTAATGSKANYLSFFAYAPYATPSGGETSGITAISGNTATGNPTISYQLAPTGANVDLLWGTFSGTTKNVLNQNNAGGIVQYNDGSLKDGNATVNINLQKQTTNGSVGFAFKHALSKVGFTVQADPNDATNDGIYNGTSGATLITVNSLNIAVVAADYTSDYSAPISGTFDLATGVWNNLGANIEFNKTFSGTSLNTTIAEPASAPTASSGAWSGLGTLVGVQKTASSVGDAANLLYLPGSVPTFKITITYTIRTADANLASPGCSEVSQTISNVVKFPTATPLAMNTKYNVNMMLGITGIKFSATVSPWGDVTGQTVNLPLNVTSN